MSGAMREMTPEEIASQIVHRKRPRAWLANDLAAIIERAEKRGARAQSDAARTDSLDTRLDRIKSALSINSEYDTALDRLVDIERIAYGPLHDR